jgi:hypothetical protein
MATPTMALEPSMSEGREDLAMPGLGKAKDAKFGDPSDSNVARHIDIRFEQTLF